MEEMNEMMEESRSETENKADGLQEVRKQFSRLGLCFFIGMLCNELLQRSVAEIIKGIHPEWLENPNISMLILITVQYLVGLPILILLVRRIPGTAPKQKTMKAGHFCMTMMMCMAVAYGSNIVGNIITMIIGLLRGTMVENVNLTLGSETSLLLNFVFMVICAPLYEEYIFRKLLVDRTAQYGQGVAIILSGLMFGLAHGNMNQFAFAFTIGVFFAFIYVKTGKLRYSILMHMFFNCYSGVLLMAVLRHMHFDEYFALMQAGDPMGAMQVMTDAMPFWVLFAVLVFIVLGAAVAGLVLLIVFWKKFKLEQGEVVIPKGKRFTTIILNAGMVLYCLFFLTSIVLQLFGKSLL